MGRVFLAVRTGEGFEKRVALKVLRPGLEGDDLLRRFRSERRILSSLEHPNIATLLDGGTTSDGRPYVVMEYVDGDTLVRHCDRAGLSVRQRLELFRKVCEAVEYAHQRLVVHRDIKPSNILVTRDGEPKLLDFGIAKLLDDERSELSIALTRTGMALFTPEYASPEQVRGEAITTASDVYSLGALLYEVLSGARPHRFETLRATEVERVVCELLPPPPSSAVNGRDGRWRRQLEGDLDMIALMALRKEPERRYASVADLSEDIERYLEGLPVSARRDSFGYRSGKFLRRHAFAVTASAALLVLVVGFGVVMAVQARRIARQRDIARRETIVAREVSEFLVDLFEVSDPNENVGNEVKARSLLDRGASQIVSELDSDPLVRAALMDTMGRAYEALGLAQEALPLLEGAYRLRENDPATLPQTASRLGSVLIAHGRYEDAERLLREGVEGALANNPGDEHAAFEGRVMLATFLQRIGRLPEALEIAESAHADAVRIHGNEHLHVAASLSALGVVLQDLDRLAEAEERLLQSFEIRLALLGREHPLTAQRSARGSAM